MKLKYYLRGLGIGILVTTIILMIAFARHPQKLTDEEIIARAEMLGMVMEDKEAGESIPKSTEQATEKDTQQLEPATEQIPEPDTQVQQLAEITIVKGDTSDVVADRLHEAGVVADAGEFNRFLIEKDYERRILPGKVQIPAGADYEQIAQILIKPR